MAQIANLKNEALKKYITVEVIIKKDRFFDFRLWLGCQLIRIGALIAGLGYQEKEGDVETIH